MASNKEIYEYFLSNLGKEKEEDDEMLFSEELEKKEYMEKEWENCLTIKAPISRKEEELLFDFKIYYFYHITHIDNLENIFKYGLLSHNNKHKKIDISNRDVNARRHKIETIYLKSIHDYVPLYFNPRNAMLYRNQMEHDSNIIILALNPTSIIDNYKDSFIFSNQNCSTDGVIFFNELEKLKEIDWETIRSHSWTQNKEKEVYIRQVMMAEFLVYEKISQQHFEKIYCQDLDTAKKLSQKFGDKIEIKINEKLFFQI
jgi:hypothetical protein